MKKIISLILAATLFSGFAFAKNYKGDIQLSMGGSAEEMKVKDAELTGNTGLIKTDITAKSGLCTVKSSIRPSICAVLSGRFAQNRQIKRR